MSNLIEAYLYKAVAELVAIKSATREQDIIKAIINGTDDKSIETMILHLEAYKESIYNDYGITKQKQGELI